MLNLQLHIDGGFTAAGKFRNNAAAGNDAAQEIADVLQNMKNGITEAEFIRAREGLKSSLRMSMENSMSRASYAGRGALVGEVLADDVLLAQVECVTPQEINALANEIFDLRKLSTSVCGTVKKPEFYKNLAQG